MTLPASDEATRDAPFYVPRGEECTLFERCHAQRLAVLLKGPTGCGKTRFVEHMAWRLGRRQRPRGPLPGAPRPYRLA